MSGQPELSVSAPGAAPARRAWRMIALLFTAALVVAGGISAGASFAIGHESSGTFTSCGAYRCFTIDHRPALTTALTERGYSCTAEFEAYPSCELRRADRIYRVGFGYLKNDLNEYQATVTSGQGDFTPAALALLTFMAEQSVGDDPDTKRDVRVWLTQRVQEKKSSTATIGDLSLTFQYGTGLDQIDDSLGMQLRIKAAL